MIEVLVVGGRGTGPTAAVATARALWDTGVPGHRLGVPRLVGSLPAGTPVRVVHGHPGDLLAGRAVRGVYQAAAVSSSTSDQAWVSLAWGEHPVHGLTVVEGSADNRGALVERANTAVVELGLSGGGVVSDGGYGDLGSVFAVCLLALVTGPAD